MRPKRQEVRVSAIWRYFIYSVLVGRCSRSLNSPPLLMIQGLFKSIFTILLFKGPKETIDVSTFLTFQIIWIFLCRFPYLEVHYSANCTLHSHQQSAPSPQISAYLIRECHRFVNPCGSMPRVRTGTGTGWGLVTLAQPAPVVRAPSGHSGFVTLLII